MSLKTRITKLHYNKDAKGVLFAVLSFFSIFYAFGCGFKNFLYKLKILKPAKVNALVISIGNLTTGGVGKTPVVAQIAKYFVNKGEKVAVISRGYGGKLNNKNVNLISDGVNLYYQADMAGDEPYWLSVNLNMCAVLTCSNRVKAAEYAINNLGTTVILLDDGFQHRKLYRDIDIVLVDSQKKFGNEHLLPAGPLREPISELKRADKLVIVSKNFTHNNIEKDSYGLPAYLCKSEPDYVYNIISGEHLPSGTEITAISAIGQPEQFYNFLEPNYKIKNTITFDDHHIYTENDIADIQGVIVTTEKDAVKLALLNRPDIYALKLKTELDVAALING